MNKKYYNHLAKLIWWVTALTFGLVIYVNYFMPHGSFYPTGEIVCQNDGRGPCNEEYKEDMSELDIPNWAKFLREYFVLVILVEFILAIHLEVKGGKQFKE